MISTKFVSAAVFAGSVFATGLASAATLVTMAPGATNGLGVNGVVSTTQGEFQTVGMSTDLFSTLTINGNSGVASFSEIGTINATQFFGNSNTVVNSGVNSNYKIQGTFSLTGLGAWSGSIYNAAPGSVSFSVNLFAVSDTNQTIQLGTATLNNASSLVGFAVAFGSVANGSTGTALTSLSSVLDFTPAAGTTGADGFFKAPTPFNISFAVGNAGGNQFNTAYSVSPTGVVTIVTPTAGNNPGTANITFVNTVPEPGALALAGLALFGVAAARRKTK